MSLPRAIAGQEIRGAALEGSEYYSIGDFVAPRYSETGSQEGTGQLVGGAAAVAELRNKYELYAQMEGGELLPSATVTGALVIKPEIKGKKKVGRRDKGRHLGVTVQPVPSEASRLPQTNEATPNTVKQAQTFDPTALSNTILQPYPQPQLRSTDRIHLSSSTPVTYDSPSIEVVFSTPLGKIRLNALAVLDSTNALALVFANEGEIRYEPAPGTDVQLIINKQTINTMYPGFKFNWMTPPLVIMVFVKTEQDPTL